MTVYLTTRELAERFRTAASTVRYWRMRGYGPKGSKIGRQVLYPLAAVETFERQRAEEPASGRQP